LIEKQIIADTQAALDAFSTFANSQRENVALFMNTIISENGTPSDASIEVTNEAIKLYQFAPDKGWVLGEQPEGAEVPVQLTQYKTLADGAKFLHPQKDGAVSLCVKTKEGSPDGILGRFKTLNDAINNFNTEGAITAYNNWKDREEAIAKREAKQEAKMLKKLNKDLSIVDAEVVEANSVSESNG